LKYQLCHPHTYYMYPYIYILHISWKIILVNVKMTRIWIFHIQRKEKKELLFKIMTFCLYVYPLMLQPFQMKQSYYNWFVKTISSHFNSTEIKFSLVDIKSYNLVSILSDKNIYLCNWLGLLYGTIFLVGFKSSPLIPHYVRN